MTYPAGTKFMKSINVYDGINTAGTIDLLAIMPDERIDILQFRVPNIPFASKDIPIYTQEAYNTEIEELRRILSTWLWYKKISVQTDPGIADKSLLQFYGARDVFSGLKLTKMTIGGVDAKLIEDDVLACSNT